MLAKKNRLAKSTEIATTFTRGRGFFNPFFSLKFLSKPDGKRFTVVVSTKVFKTAVKRNRLKRIAREFVRKNLQGLRSGDYVITARAKISSLPEKEVLPALSDVFSKLK